LLGAATSTLQPRHRSHSIDTACASRRSGSHTPLSYTEGIVDFSSSAGPTRIGRYEIKGRVGSGSFATVYLAHDPTIDAPVAIKVLADSHSAVPEIREGFVRRARLLRHLQSDRVVAVYDIGEVDGQPYFVMEALMSGTLDDRMKSQPTWGAAAVRRVVGELGDCLKAAHDGGVVHRCIKPSNILVRAGETAAAPGELLSPDDRLILGDFGLALEQDTADVTMSGGTDSYIAPEYTAPEQQQPVVDVDHRADLYSATAIIAHLLTGSPRPDAELHALRPEVASALRAGLAVAPTDRPQNAELWTRSLLSSLKAMDDPHVAAVRQEATHQNSSTDMQVAPTEANSSLLAEPAPSAPLTAWNPRWLIPVVAVVLLVVGLAGTMFGASGPQILGPSEVFVGDTAVFSYEAREGATYVWRDEDGTESPDPRLQIDSFSPGSVSITLMETINGETSESTVTITVRKTQTP